MEQRKEKTARTARVRENSTKTSRLIWQNGNILDFHYAPNHKLPALVSRKRKELHIADYIGIDTNLVIE